MPKDTDVAAIVSLKNKITQNVEKMWDVNVGLWQKTALFLYPPALSAQQTDLNDIKNFCVSLIQNLLKITPTSSAFHSIPTSPCTPCSDSVAQFSFTQNSISIHLDTESTNQPSYKKEVQFFSLTYLKKQHKIP